MDTDLEFLESSVFIRGHPCHPCKFNQIYPHGKRSAKRSRAGGRGLARMDMGGLFDEDGSVPQREVPDTVRHRLYAVSGPLEMVPVPDVSCMRVAEVEKPIYYLIGYL